MSGQFSTLNYRLALARVGGDEALFREIAQLFLDEYPGLLTSLKQAVADGQSESVHQTAHTLKGSLGTLAAEAAYQTALMLETMGRRSDLTGAEAALSALDDLIARLDAELRELTW